MAKLFRYRFLALVCYCISLGLNGFSQTTIFSENIGTPAGTTSIAAYAGWQNNGVLTFSNGGATNPADVRITSVSGTYTGASAGGNVFFTSTSGNYGFSIESINAAIYNTLVLQFGYRKETAGSHAALSVEYWDGAAWVVIANTSAALFNEAGTAATGWYLSKALSLPAPAQINGLKIRFVKSGTASIRVDDIKLTGIYNNPTTTSISPSVANVGDPGFTLTVNGTNFSNTQSTVTWNGANRTTTYVSATQLTAAIPGSDLAASGVALVGVTTTGAAAASNTQSFTINAASGGTLTLTGPLTGFGNVCINTTTSANSFTLDGNSLDGSAISLAALPGFAYSETLGGTYTSTLSFTYTGNSFTGKVIYVKFNPSAVQSYNGTINLTGGGLLTSYPVTATGAGVNTLPTVTTGGSSAVTATSGTVAGTINDPGCGTIIAYGIEYSTSSGFPEGTGIQIPCSNLSAGVFSTNITGLLPNTRYYYKAYGVSTIDTTYGTQQAFTCTPLPVPMGLQPGLSYTQDFTDVGTWGDFFTSGNGANHFGGLSANLVGSIPDGIKVTASTANFQSNSFTSSGGVHRFIDQTTPTQSIILLSTGSPDNTTSAAIDFYMDFTGVNAGTLSFDYTTINNSTGNRNGSLRVYATVDGTTFTELPFADVLDFTNNVPISGSKTNIALPAMFNNSATARLRFYYHNGSGNTGSGSRPKISIDNLNVTAVATTPCASPAAPATNLSFGTITDVSIAGSFTASAPASDEYLVVASVNSSLTGNPIDGQIYNVGDNLGDGTVVSRSNSTSFTATGLTPLTQYYFFVFPLNSICTGGPLYNTTSVLNGTASTIAGLPPCAAPASQPTGLILNPPAPTINTIQGSFTATTADEYLVLRSTATTLSNTPVNAQVYNAGDILGNAVVVSRGASTSFTANGLQPNTQYYFFIFSLNSSSCVNGPVYNTVTPLTGTETTQPLPPCVAPPNQPAQLNLTASNTAVSGTFTGISGADDYLVIQSLSPTLSATPVDNTDYAVGDAFGGGIVVANSSLTTFLSTSLTANTTYYYFVFAANKNCSGGTKYATGASLNNSIVTGNVLTNNYYFGTLHSHSDYSDGNQDHPGYTPTDDYAYAMTAQCMDYLGISEHNHFSTVNNPGNTVTNYHLGVNEATTFTNAHPGFLALYGMEWGVISGGGHVVIYGDGMDNLWGWESGSGAWGSANNYDVYVPKSTYTGNTGLFKTVNDNKATNTFATLAHPNLTDYNNIAGTAYDIVADSAITGAAVESGPATTTNTTYSNPGSSLSYLWYYQTMLSKGYHLGPTIDHDNHNTTFGHTTYSRTAIVAPALTKTALVTGMKNMNFYATQDCDSKVDFTINTKIMGSLIADRFAPNIAVNLTDLTTSTSGAIIRVMYGVPGSGVLPVKIDSVIGNSLRFTDINLPDNTTGYYYIDITNGTSRIVTSPIWYTRNDAAGGPLPVKLNSFTVQKINNSAKITWSTEQEINSSHFIVERSVDGRTWNTIATVAAAGNSSHRIDYAIYDNAPMRGINYYRLKEVDKDAKYDYSDIKKALFNSNYTAEVVPNPAKDFINVYIARTGNQQATVQVLNADGKMVYKTNTTQSHLQINTTGMSKGLYLVKVIDADNVTTLKVIVQ
ncbi:T9SS type A sorting domain-containing protein [Ferruginibacter profundus]